MRKPYAPREGTLADKVMGLLEINGGALSALEISQQFSVSAASVKSGLLRAVDNELLFTYVKGWRKYYTLVRPEDRRAAATAPPSQPPTTTLPVMAARLDDFHAAVWADGELNLHGVAPNDSGVTVLSADQAAQVLRLLSGRMYA